MIGCVSNSLSVEIVSSNTLNQTTYHKSLPVAIRIYQLRSKEQFSRLSFAALWGNDRKLLGNDLLDCRTVIVLPGSDFTLNIDRNKNVHYLAIMGLFRKASRSCWRSIVTLPKRRSFSALKIKVMVHGNKVHAVLK
ncbi:MAG: type VI secretion system lipoprotein TssJ [Gammaproteobacteria bacterium]|nr:type VI secretion system lipoprotein TssJ [Gammaproteobacteria bacterium]